MLHILYIKHYLYIPVGRVCQRFSLHYSADGVELHCTDQLLSIFQLDRVAVHFVHSAVHLTVTNGRVNHVAMGEIVKNGQKYGQKSTLLLLVFENCKNPQVVFKQSISRKKNTLPAGLSEGPYGTYSAKH